MESHDDTSDADFETMNGLSAKEAKKKSVEHGYNEVPEKRARYKSLRLIRA